MAQEPIDEDAREYQERWEALDREGLPDDLIEDLLEEEGLPLPEETRAEDWEVLSGAPPQRWRWLPDAVVVQAGVSWSRFDRVQRYAAVYRVETTLRSQFFFWAGFSWEFGLQRAVQPPPLFELPQPSLRLVPRSLARAPQTLREALHRCNEAARMGYPRTLADSVRW